MNELLLTTLVRIEAEQKRQGEKLARMETKLDSCGLRCSEKAENADGRITAVEHTLNGGADIAGLAEEVRTLKHRWALLTAAGSLAMTAFLHFLPDALKLLAKKTGGQ